MTYPYETLDYVGRVVFKDAFGLECYYHTYQRLRVLQAELFTVVQRYWGWGDPVHEVVAPAAAAIHLVPDSDPPAIVLILKAPAKRGDELEIHTIRRLHHAFKSDRGIWEYKPFTPTERVQLAIDFPIAREPEAIYVSMSPGAPSPYVRRPGTKELTFTLKGVLPGALYRADWAW
jgi:hypothetical protein